MEPETPRHSVSVAAAVVDPQGRVLAARRRDTGRWEPPGGVLELGESIPAGVKREVLEESGLHVQPLMLTGVYKNMRRGIVALVFRCVALDGTLATTAEVMDFAWLTRDEIPSRMEEAYAVRMLDALTDNGPHVRAHDGHALLLQ